MQLVLLALATFASEDLACLAAGALIAQGKISFVEGTIACSAGIFAGDMLLYLVGRLAWHSNLFARLARKWVPQAKLDRASDWLTAKGLSVVLLSRFTPGLRLPTYVAAGLLGCSAWSFAGYFVLAALLWTPLLVGGAAFIGDRVQGTVGPAGFVALGAGLIAWHVFRNGESRRRWMGFLQRKIRWEFWPAWAAYLPLIPYFIYLAIRHRSITLFTASNPGIESGGLSGESKSAILRKLSRVSGAVADYRVVTDAEMTLSAIGELGLEFPVVIKPDVGERGSGVAIVRSECEVRAYFERSGPGGVSILQRYVPGVEYGVYYVRYPEQPRGRVVSITEKVFPSVSGDGVSTLRELILRDSRAVCIAAAYEESCRHSMEYVPAAGERVQLVELGSHCRGAIFLDGIQHKSRFLEDAVDRVAKAHPGFFIGRFDVRSPSPEAFRRGEFLVIELNGVSAEPAHIYDPAISLADAYRWMAWQWRTAFEIGARNRALGSDVLSFGGLIQVIRRRWSGSEVVG
jgi:membrane protein DedA with SNARE-associated domain